MRTTIESPAVAPPFVQVEYHVRFTRGPRGRRRAREASAQPAAPLAAPTSGVPKITRLLVLGHHFERLVREGAVRDYAEIARLTGLTRARVTQIVNLTLLAPQIQEDILNLPNVTRGPDPFSECALREVAAHADWRIQNGACVPLRRRLESPPAD